VLSEESFARVTSVAERLHTADDNASATTGTTSSSSSSSSSYSGGGGDGGERHRRHALLSFIKSRLPGRFNNVCFLKSLLALYYPITHAVSFLCVLPVYQVAPAG
jgi:hypothetical protein